MQLSSRVTALAESATIAVSSRAARMKREGVDVVAFGAGEPDFDTPDPITSVAKSALDAGKTKYAPAYGLPEAREAVCVKLKRDNNLTYTPDQTIITCGGKEAIYLALAALVNPGDEVILPVPYWVSFPEMIRLCGGVVREIRPASRDFKIQPGELRAALSPRTRAFIFNSPSNPGGFTYTPDETRALADVLRDNSAVIIADEIYDQLAFGGFRPLSMASIDADMYARTITCNAASKSYAMTGWRVGYAAGPRPAIDAMSRLQSHTTSGPCTFNQLAMAAALAGDQATVAPMRNEFAQRGAHMHARLCKLRNVQCAAPTGAFYCFPRVCDTYARLQVGDSVAFADIALDRAHVAVVPGSAFGSDDHVRLSFATSMEQIDKGIDRLASLLGTA